MSSTRTITINYLTRVEGEANVKVKVKSGRVAEVQLNIFEPPRLFEAMLLGRRYYEPPDITSRICGICPIAYQTSAMAAIEDILDVHPAAEIRKLRRLIYCGEWIESHVLHIYMLHAPDFFGCDNAFQLARAHRKIVERGLQLKKVGNALLTLLGGREIHPVNLKVGGFYRAPSRSDLRPLVEQLKWASDAAEETVRWVAGFDFPDWERDYEFVSLRASEPVYPIEEGSLVSSRGLAISVREFEDWIIEEQVPWSTALQASIKGRGEYLTGPLARINLNFDRLSPRVKDVAQSVGFAPPCRNPFRSIVARALEVLYACDEALRLIESYEPPKLSSEEVTVRAGTGCGASEAPRGVLYHRYRIDGDGIIQDARIVPPTSQNQKCMEQDLWQFVDGHLDMPKEELRRKCEQVVRNHDPCISCSTHYLNLHWEES